MAEWYTGHASGESERNVQRQPTTARRGTMPRAIRAWGWILRLAACALLFAMALVAVLAACSSADVTPSSDFDPGGTYGAEISLTIIGRGRVTTMPAAIDCPSSCFARIVLDSASVDGGDGGITLLAQGTTTAHFVGWSFADVDLGARARGPSQCSPMTRKASVPAVIDHSTVITVPFGETKGTPPRGHEEECAAFTSVSLAYAVTATFEEDPPQPGFDAAPPDEADLDVLFLPKTPGSQAQEIGVTGGYAYWRFSLGGPASGVAGSYLASGGFDEIVQPTRIMRSFHVDRHAVFQYGDDDSLWVIPGGQLSASLLGVAPPCLALASDALNVYCRAAVDGGTAIYAWPVSGGDPTAPSIVHVLPFGSALAVDTQRFYFSQQDDSLPNHAKILSTTRNADVDGGIPLFTTVAVGQTSPSGMVAVGPSFLAWLDELGGTVAARSSAKVSFGAAPSTSLGASAIRYVAGDPSTNEYWIGVGNDGAGAWQIYRAIAGGTSGSTTFFRSGTTDLGGLAADATYVYWTRPNGRVYQAFRNGNGRSGP